MADAKLFVISGPSGAGKGTIVKRILASGEDVYLSVSATTRPPRAEEKDGVDYDFITKPEFQAMVDESGFLEYALVHGNFYGTPKAPVMEQLEAGRDVILEIDVQGAMSVKKSYPNGTFIFILPPSIEELKSRICGRGTESAEDAELRLNKAETEMGYLEYYDYFVMNKNLDEAVNDVLAIMRAGRCSVGDAENASQILKRVKGEL